MLPVATGRVTARRRRLLETTGLSSLVSAGVDQESKRITSIITVMITLCSMGIISTQFLCFFKSMRMPLFLPSPRL